MVAAENDALPGAKVGGVGDVLRDLPEALIEQGAQVDCVIPSYGFLSRLAGLTAVGVVRFPFAAKYHEVEILKRSGEGGEPDHYIFHHEAFYIHGERIYIHDEDGGPFASDARKFAFFCAAVGHAVLQGLLPKPTVFHCHDWHAAYLIILLRYEAAFAPLKKVRSVFTIHNLAMQGIRPLAGDSSSLNAWFPTLRYSLIPVQDLRYTDCLNPMRAAIVLANKVHTVSPSYAEEILLPSDTAQGIYGGEGLERDLIKRKEEHALVGILNGCRYTPETPVRALSRAALADVMMQALARWAATEPMLRSAHWLAEKHIARWCTQNSDGFLVTAIGRLTEQKFRILQTALPSGKTVLETLLDKLGSTGSLIVLGSGDGALETFFTQIAAEHESLIFLNGYSDVLSSALYQTGDLFLMPSSFEPCGISQMLAMRSGQPCLVNAVGGLKDTVIHEKTGFVFSGENINEHALAFINMFDYAKHMHDTLPKRWQEIKDEARAQRFGWDVAAREYIKRLYT